MLQNGAQIVVLLPIRGHLGIDHAGFLVEYRLGISVLADRSEDRLPNLKVSIREWNSFATQARALY